MSKGYFVPDPDLPALRSDEQVAAGAALEEQAWNTSQLRKRFSTPKIGEPIDLDRIPFSEGGGSSW